MNEFQVKIVATFVFTVVFLFGLSKMDVQHDSMSWRMDYFSSTDYGFGAPKLDKKEQVSFSERGC